VEPLIFAGPFHQFANSVEEEELLDQAAAHIAPHDPARVLAECEATGELVDYLRRASRHTPIGQALLEWGRIVAGVYADHPDYQQEWAS
jgi:hypothetical protein